MARTPRRAARVLPDGLPTRCRRARGGLRPDRRHGRVHVTDDASKVPPATAITPRPHVRSRVKSLRGRPQEDEQPRCRSRRCRTCGTAAPARRRRGPAAHARDPRPARGPRDAPRCDARGPRGCNFKVDTGASLNTIPRWAIDDGIEIDRMPRRLGGRRRRRGDAGAGRDDRSCASAPSSSRTWRWRCSTHDLGPARHAVLQRLQSGDRRRGSCDRGPTGSVEACTRAWAPTPLAPALPREAQPQIAAVQKVREAIPSEQRPRTRSHMEWLDREEAACSSSSTTRGPRPRPQESRAPPMRSGILVGRKRSLIDSK